MTQRSRKAFAFVALLAFLSPLFVSELIADGSDFTFNDNLGAGFFQTSPPCPLKRFPTLEALATVPLIVDPFEQDIIPLFCQISVSKGGNPVKGAKGNFESALVVIDNETGMVETFSLGDGKFKTNSDGFAGFDFEIPAPLFADGFESGDVSAWSYTRVDFKKKKKADSADVFCFTSGSK